MRASFHRIEPDFLHLIPHILTDFLSKAIEESPTSDLTLEDAIAYSKSGAGDIYAVMGDSKPIGAVFYQYGHGNNGRILDVALLGGKRFMAWRKQAYDFTVKLAKDKNCAEIWVMGREGWGRVFPDMEQIGVVYRLRVGVNRFWSSPCHN